MLLIWLVHWILLQILLFWLLNPASSATVYFPCYYLMRMLLKSIHYKYTKPALNAIKCLSLNDFWGFDIKKFFFRVSVFSITTLLIIYMLFIFAAEYIKKNTLLTFCLLCVQSVMVPNTISSLCNYYFQYFSVDLLKGSTSRTQ